MDCCECDCSEEKKEEICCPEINPKKWDKKAFVWKNKTFIKGDVLQIMHIPLNFGQVITSLVSKAEKAKALPKGEYAISLSRERSPWKSELYLATTKKVSDAKNAVISGKFLSRAFDGPYNSIPAFMKEMENYLKEKGKSAETLYFYYAYCPKCSKKYSHNYIIIIAKVG